jgi:hypothetical protein
MSGIERNSENIRYMLKKIDKEGYIVTGMDGETFGHHRIGMERTLMDLYKNSYGIEFVKLSDLILDNSYKIQDIIIRDSTWASSVDDILKNKQFISWKDPENIIHTWQWELVDIMLTKLNLMDTNNSKYSDIRTSADKALASDQFFWASAKPWWSVEMIEAGVHLVLNVIESIPKLPKRDLMKARSLYRSIVSTAFEWQRSGKIREINKERNNVQRIPFKRRTLEKGGSEIAVYNAFIDMMKKQEKVAARNCEYEKATLWRDAVYKIETMNDIYDAINAIDLLRKEISNEKVEKMLDEYTKEYKKIRGGQPEQRSN